MPTNDVKIKVAQNDPKNTSTNLMGHDSAHRGVCNVFDILPYQKIDPPKHVLQRTLFLKPLAERKEKEKK